MTEIKYGIVIDNKDIHETGKIRVIVLEALPAAYRNKNISELKIFLANMDLIGNYIPWQKSTNKTVADPHLAVPFLPQHINLIPAEGQLVKLLTFTESAYCQYIGPEFSSLDNPKESYSNALTSFRSTTKKDLIKNGFVNKVDDFSLYGNNSQLILSDKELFLRTNHQDVVNKKKNVNLTLLQQSTFNTSLSVKKDKVKTLFDNEKLISHILEIDVRKEFRSVLNENTIKATFTLKNVLEYKDEKGKIGVTDRTYSPANNYDVPEEIVFVLECDDIKEVHKHLDQIRLSLINKTVDDLSKAVVVGGSYVTEIETPNTKLSIIDYRTMTRGLTEITDRKEVEVISFVIKSDPNFIPYESSFDALDKLGVPPTYVTTNPKFYSKEKNNLIGINKLIDSYKQNLKVESKLTGASQRVIEEETSNLNYDQKKDSYTVQASDKILFLSTQVQPNLISNNPNRYGLTQKDLANLTDIKKQETFSMVRGEKLIETMNRLIDLFLSHGHSHMNTVKNSLEEGTRNELTKLKEEINKKVNGDLSGGSNLLNQYIRLN